MRATLEDATLVRDAGRFVWLELDFDKPGNQAFIRAHRVTYTPTLLVLDPANERATATQLGGLKLAELRQFLDRGERGVKGSAKTPADAALGRADALSGRGQLADAVAAYREALRLAKPGWPEHDQALASLALSLMTARESEACADLAVAEAPAMQRGPAFASVVRSGFASAGMGGAAPWAAAARKVLEPLAAEAVALPSTMRDDRFQLYQNLMSAAQTRGDKAAVGRWGRQWLSEIDATKPADDDERSALDIARVDAASEMEAPDRVLAALVASEKAMPKNYNASLRLAQVEVDAKRYNDALAACDRGLLSVTGPIGRTWLLETKADAFLGKGNQAAARRALEDALRAAQTIGTKASRDNNVRKVSARIRDEEK